jgi:hypothetical protein
MRQERSLEEQSLVAHSRTDRQHLAVAQVRVRFRVKRILTSSRLTAVDFESRSVKEPPAKQAVQVTLAELVCRLVYNDR